MDPSQFSSHAAGRAVKMPSGYWAFIPASPCETVKYDPSLVLLLSQADSALSELSGLGRVIPNPDLLIEPYIKREAVASSRIEGTQADLSDLLLDEMDPRHTPAGSDVYEIRNYVAALNLGLRRLQKLPLAGRLIQQMHALLLRGVRGENMTPGEYRRTQNWIGPPGSTLATATYVPPPPNEMHECLAAWERFSNRRGQLPDLIQCAIMHESFEAIHPFLDGNGRIGRLLITLFLIERGRLAKPLLYLSSYIEAHRKEYYELLQRIRTHGDWDPWIRYFLGAVRDTSRSALDQSQSILQVREKYRQLLKNNLRSLALLDSLFINPYTTVARAAKTLEVAAPTAQKAIDQLVKIGMLKEATGRGWGRHWLAKPILHILNRPFTPPSSAAGFPDRQNSEN